MRKNLTLQLLVFFTLLFAGVAFGQTVSSFAPSVVTYRTKITITGTGLTGYTSVKIGTANATNVVATASQITATVPDLNVSGGTDTNVTITVGNGTTTRTISGLTYIRPAQTNAASAKVTRVITDYNGYWSSAAASSSPASQPDMQHSVLAMQFGNVMYSTGVSDATLTAKGVSFTAGDFKALPINAITGTSGGGSNYIALATKMDGSASTLVPSAPGVAGLITRDILIDGKKGLGLGSGMTNITNTAVMLFNVNNIVTSRINDAEPDIIVSQTADPSTGSDNSVYDVYAFVDADGNVVGNPVYIVLNSIPAIGTYKLDLFSMQASQPYESATILSTQSGSPETRDIRLVGYKLSDFGITDANKHSVTGFKIMPSGVSDPAFIAYNGNSLLIPAPQITTHPASVVACTGAGSSATFSVAATGNNLSYQWKKNGLNIAGATAATYTINNVSAADVATYTVAVTNAAGAVISNPAYLNTIIAVQPVDVSACLNAPGPVVEVIAYGLNLSYQWYVNTTASTTGATAVSGATSASYTPPATATRYYYCVITNNSQGCTVQNTNIVKYSVGSAAVAGTASITGALGIALSTYYTCAGTSGIVMKSTGATSGASYQWEKSTDGTTGWVNVTGGTGATTVSYTTGAVSEITYYRLRVTTGSCVVYTNTVIINIDNYPGVISPSVSICSGTSTTLTTQGATGNLIWQYSTNGTTWIDILLTFMPSYTTPNLTTTTYFRVRSNVVLGCGFNYSDVTTVTVMPLPAAGTAAGAQTLCQGATANLSLTGATGAIQWEQSANGLNGWAPVTDGTGGMTANYTTAPMQATTWYRAAVTSNYCTTYSDAVKVTVNTIVAGAISANVSICAGSVAVLVVTGSIGNNIQWQESVNGTDGWANVSGGSGANTAIYTTVSLFSTKYYRAIVTNGSCQAITAVVAVNVDLANLGTISLNHTVCYGQPAILTALGATGLLQWQESANGINGWANVTAGSGATTDTYVTAAITVKRYFRLSVTAGLCNTLSSAITVDVSPLSNAGTVSANKVICSGGTTALAVTGTTGTLQWQQSADGVTGWADVSTGTGATTANFTTAALTATTYYRVLATSGSCTAATSSTVTVTVNTAIAGTVSGNQSICGGSTATVSVTGSAGNLQWQQSVNGTTGWANITGATSASYTPILLATTYYRVIATSGSCTATSDVVTVNVSNPPTAGTATGTVLICPGESAPLAISGQNGNIQWQQSANGTTGWANISGATYATYTATAVTTTTYFRVMLTNGVCEQASNIVTVTVNNNFIWNGSVSSDWHTAANWSCNAIPTLADNCIIPLRTNQPIVSQNIMAYGKTLDIQAGVILTVNTERNITVKDGIAVAATGNMIVNNMANLVQINDVANTGNIVVKRNSSKLFRQDYTLWSTPVTGQKVFQFSPQTLADRFYTYRDSARLYMKVLNLSATSTTTLAKGVAYLIRMPNGNPAAGYNAGTASITLNQQFTGVPNNGTIQIPVVHEWTQNSPGALSEYGWNGVGNPYPSTINIHNFIDTNSENLETGILYFWRKKNNNSNTSYTAINKTGYAENRAEGGDVGHGFTDGDEANWVINPGQGFIVQVKQGAATIEFNNSMRRAVNNTQFFRNAQAGQMSRMWINMESAEGAFSQTLLGYSSFTTDGLDYGYDGFLNNDGVLALYTKAANKNLVIQAKGEFNITDVVPLHYRANAEGPYTIKLHKKDGIFANGQNVYLRDTETGNVHDFATGAYTFEAVQGTTEGRFEIIYTTNSNSNVLGNATLKFTEKSILAYKKDNTLMVETPGNQIDEVRIFDVRGRLLHEQKNTNSESSAINIAAQEQMLIVQVTTTDGAKATKKVIY